MSYKHHHASRPNDFPEQRNFSEQCLAVWNEEKKTFETTFDGGSSGQVTEEIDPIKYNSMNGFKPQGFNVFLYPEVAKDWRSQEKYAQLRNQPTYRYKGWCIVKFNSSYVDFHDMEGEEESIRMEVEDFGKSVFFFGHHGAEEQDLFERACHNCFD